MVVDGEGNEVGKVTSGGFSPMLEAPIAMAYVPAASAEPGTQVTLAQRGKIFEARVVRCRSSPTATKRKGASKP
jgi:aminomethyltransferase